MTNRENFEKRRTAAWPLAVLLVCVAASPVSAGAVFDDFTSDTISDYTQGAYQSASPSNTFNIDTGAGVLVGTAAGGSDRLMHDTARLGVGASFEVDILSLTDNDGTRAGILLSAGPAPAIGVGDAHFHFWMNGDGGGMVKPRLYIRNWPAVGNNNNVQNGTSVAGSSMKLRIDRVGVDDYEFYVDDSLFWTETDRFAASHVGMEVYRFGTTTVGEFGYMKVTPEPSSLMLLGLGLIGLAGCRRRSRRN